MKEAVKGYPFLRKAVVVPVDAPSQVSDQPKTLEETVAGAIHRAKGAFRDCDLSFGIEDGLMAVPETLTGFMNVCVCAVYDGKKTGLGLSSAFEYPPKAVQLIMEEGLDINQAFYEMKLTANPKIGSAEGAVSILTKGKWKRRDTVRQSITAALINLENEGLYQ